MPIYEYEEDEHPAGFIGLRLQLSVGNKLRSRYWRYRNKKAPSGFYSEKQIKEFKKEAKELEEKWLKDRKKYNAYINRHLPPKRNKHCPVGVRCVSLVWKDSADRHGGRYLPKPTLYAQTRINKKAYTLTVCFENQKTYKGAIDEIFTWLRKQKKLKAINQDWYNRMPNYKKAMEYLNEF